MTDGNEKKPVIGTLWAILPDDDEDTEFKESMWAIIAYLQDKVPIYVPGAKDYERSVLVSNRLYRFYRPSCVVQPESSSHVRTIIHAVTKHGKKAKVPLTIKCGGHSYAGFSTAERGISMDLSKMKSVIIDDKTNNVTTEGGAQWAHMYRQLVNGGYNGLIINGGRCSSVGVGGFVLGGGLGPFTRSVGMGCDSLKEATIVTADGNLVTVKDTDKPDTNEGKLFWALRGGGQANFGVLVEMKLAIHKLQSKGTVVAGRYTWFFQESAFDDPDLGEKNVLNTMNRFYTAEWPNEMTIDSTWICDLRKAPHQYAIRFPFYFDGNKEEAVNIINEHIKNDDLAKQLRRRALTEDSTLFLHETLDAQWSEETQKALPGNQTYSVYTSFCYKNDPDSIDLITQIVAEEMKAFRDLFKGENASLVVTWIHSGGKAKDGGPHATAFPWRETDYHVYIDVEWDEKFLEKDMKGFKVKFEERLRPFSLNGEAVYLNFPDRTMAAGTYEKAYWGAENYKKLQEVKRIWDKDNFFDWAQGVKPQTPEGCR